MISKPAWYKTVLLPCSHNLFPIDVLDSMKHSKSKVMIKCLA